MVNITELRATLCSTLVDKQNFEELQKTHNIFSKFYQSFVLFEKTQSNILQVFDDHSIYYDKNKFNDIIKFLDSIKRVVYVVSGGVHHSEAKR